MDDANEKRLDILYVITKSNWGGAQRYVYECAMKLQGKFSCAVALGGDGALATKLHEAKIPTHTIQSFERDIDVKKEVRAFFELFFLFRRLRPRVVHLNSSKAGGLGALAAQLARVPKVIFTSHGLAFEEDRPQWQRYLVAFFTWLTFVLCDRVILVSEANLATAKKMPFVSSRLRLIRLGISPFETLPQKEARTALARKTASLRPDLGIWVGTIAELHPNKGLTHLVDAIKIISTKHAGVRCVVIGEGELRDALERRIKENHLEEMVFLVGFVENAYAYLSAFNIFTLTSTKEGLPYVVLEAGLAGVPFVGSALPGIQEIVADMKEGVLVQPKKAKEIAGALELLITDAPRREAYGAELKRHVEKTFDLNVMLERLAGLYTEK